MCFSGGIPLYAATMSKAFEELDFRKTAMGDLTLRRRRVPVLEDQEIYEVVLGEAFLMSSLFHDVEVALADLCLAERKGPMDVVVGGLGLGYTAEAVLRHSAVRSLVVVEAMEAVIDWHVQGVVPLGGKLTADPRCRFVHGNFFELAAKPEGGFDPGHPGSKFHAILLDIDHSPRNLLAPSHASFYLPEGLNVLARHLHPGGIFGMWSDDPPDEVFLRNLGENFPGPEARTVKFANPLLDSESSSTVYLAKKPL
jgi:spermidine synthase